MVAACSFCNKQWKAALFSVCFLLPVTPVASLYLWVIRSRTATTPPPPQDLVEVHESSVAAGGKTSSWSKQTQSLRTTCHNMLHEQARWLNHWYVGHMVPVVTVKLKPFESLWQHGKLLGGAGGAAWSRLRLQEFYSHSQEITKISRGQHAS